MKTQTKKGFTIVELVIVIAIIAILAAVLIPTFSNLIRRANESADIQAVRQMNTYLAINEITEGKTIIDVYTAFENGGMTAKNYKPMVSGRYYFWDMAANRIIYAEYNTTSKKYDVIFPEDYTKQGQWFSLTDDIEKESYGTPTVDDGTATINISTGGQLAKLVSDLKDITEGRTGVLEGCNFESGITSGIKQLKGNIVINLTNDIDLGGASFNINLKDANFTLNGNGYTLSGICNATGFAESSNNSAGITSEYGAAIVGYATNSNITFENVKIKDSYFGSEKVKASAVFVGQAVIENSTTQSTGTVTFKNTTVENCTVKGKKGVAIYVGHSNPIFANNTLEIKFDGSNTATNCYAEAYDTGSEGLIGIITGRTTLGNGNNTAKLTLTGPAPIVNNITMKSRGKELNYWYVTNNSGTGTGVESYNGTTVELTNTNN